MEKFNSAPFRLEILTPGGTRVVTGTALKLLIAKAGVDPFTKSSGGLISLDFQAVLSDELDRSTATLLDPMVGDLVDFNRVDDSFNVTKVVAGRYIEVQCVENELVTFEVKWEHLCAVTLTQRGGLQIGKKYEA